MIELPKLWGVLYAAPNPDGSTKLCENCTFFIADRERCSIHPPNLRIRSGFVCGYHVNGRDGKTLDPVDPKLSGLEDVSNVDGLGFIRGTTCSSCRFFEAGQPGTGLCHAVADHDGLPPAPVAEMGCCARWESA